MKTTTENILYSVAITVVFTLFLTIVVLLLGHRLGYDLPINAMAITFDGHSGGD